MEKRGKKGYTAKQKEEIFYRARYHLRIAERIALGKIKLHFDITDRELAGEIVNGPESEWKSPFAKVALAEFKNKKRGKKPKTTYKRNPDYHK